MKIQTAEALAAEVKAGHISLEAAIRRRDQDLLRRAIELLRMLISAQNPTFQKFNSYISGWRLNMNLICSANIEQFGEHCGRQFRSPRYMYCGCDAGYCETHAAVNPFIPYEAGQPRKCRKHAKAAKERA